MPSEHPEKYSFLVDVNLPKRFEFFNQENFLHVVDINPRMTDEEIWDYAIQHNKVILTKDADFYNKAISSSIKPKIIYFRLGNITLAGMHQFFELNWRIILSHLDKADLIIVEKDRINVMF